MLNGVNVQGTLRETQKLILSTYGLATIEISKN